ncbi:MAG TPA: hypothetical protein VJB37_01125 [Patescibacteria group bacterium]|nr:hypothetical protein [Patescibacteria group bacterium]
MMKEISSNSFKMVAIAATWSFLLSGIGQEVMMYVVLAGFVVLLLIFAFPLGLVLLAQHGESMLAAAYGRIVTQPSLVVGVAAALLSAFWEQTASQAWGPWHFAAAAAAAVLLPYLAWKAMTSWHQGNSWRPEVAFDPPSLYWCYLMFVFLLWSCTSIFQGGSGTIPILLGAPALAFVERRYPYIHRCS